jgi:hypothetical protein
MREIIGVALSSVLFYLSNRMGTIIKLTGRGWKQPYRTYYKLINASHRVRTWGQRPQRSSRGGEQLGRGTTYERGGGPFGGKTVIPMLGSTDLGTSGRKPDLFSSSGSSIQNEDAPGQERLAVEPIVKPFGEQSSKTQGT